MHEKKRKEKKKMMIKCIECTCAFLFDFEMYVLSHFLACCCLLPCLNAHLPNDLNHSFFFVLVKVVLEHVIGEGSFGRVWSASWHSSKVAVKEFVFAQAAVAAASSSSSSASSSSSSSSPPFTLASSSASFNNSNSGSGGKSGRSLASSDGGGSNHRSKRSHGSGSSGGSKSGGNKSSTGGGGASGLSMRDPASMRRQLIEEIVGEAGLMSYLRHPRILQLFGCSLTAQAIWIVSELCALGSLRQVIDLLRQCRTRNSVVSSHNNVK